MSEERVQGPEIHPVLGRMGTSADPAAKRALIERAETYPHVSETGWMPRPVSPEVYLERLRSGEVLADLYRAAPKPVPNNRPTPADTEEWLNSFAPAAEPREEGQA